MIEYVDAPKLLNVSALARYLGISRRAIRAWYWEGILPDCRRIKKRQYWLKAEIDDWLEKKRDDRLPLGLRPRDSDVGLPW